MNMSEDGRISTIMKLAEALVEQNNKDTKIFLIREIACELLNHQKDTFKGSCTCERVKYKNN